MSANIVDIAEDSVFVRAQQPKDESHSRGPDKAYHFTATLRDPEQDWAERMVDEREHEPTVSGEDLFKELGI